MSLMTLMIRSISAAWVSSWVRTRASLPVDSAAWLMTATAPLTRLTPPWAEDPAESEAWAAAVAFSATLMTVAAICSMALTTESVWPFWRWAPWACSSAEAESSSAAEATRWATSLMRSPRLRISSCCSRSRRSCSLTRARSTRDSTAPRMSPDTLRMQSM